MADIISTRRDSTGSEGIPSYTCGACRFEKSLQVGMLTSAVQPARNGRGKGKGTEDKPSPAGSDAPAVKEPEA
ncbi:hypothetical protein AAVH_18392 [Aphelenchoides avenae]|nr:hypothetical protein AAVH_18392 [Aphelenchus avenae]